MQMFDPVNIQKLIVFSGLAEHKPTCDCRNSQCFPEAVVNMHRLVLSLLRALAKALRMCPQKRNIPSQSNHSKVYHQELVEKIVFLNDDLLFMQYVLYNNNVFPGVNICLFPTIFSGPLANFN